MNVYLTLDYELFLGEKTGTPENCLIRPMDELCKVAVKHNVKFVIFVDASYLLRMQQLKGQFKEVGRQFDLVSKHVRSLSEKGHDIELHFHPQWLYSNWNTELQEWEMDRDHYKLSDMPLQEVDNYFNKAKILLDDIVGYNTIAFRAGGFCLDNFSEYKELFWKAGLKIDSSVARMKYFRSSIHSYDYRDIPKEQIYPFNNSIKTKDEKGNFMELSISSYKWPWYRYFTTIRPKRVKFTPKVVYSDGNRIVDKKTSVLHKIFEAVTRKYYLASIDGEWSNLLDLYYSDAEKRRWKEMVLIGHPKNASDQSINNLDLFLDSHPKIDVLTTKDI